MIQLKLQKKNLQKSVDGTIFHCDCCVVWNDRLSFYMFTGGGPSKLLLWVVKTKAKLHVQTSCLYWAQHVTNSRWPFTPLCSFCFSFSLTHTQSWTHNISKEKEFLRKLVMGGVIRDLTNGIWRYITIIQPIASIIHRIKVVTAIPADRLSLMRAGGSDLTSNAGQYPWQPHLNHGNAWFLGCLVDQSPSLRSIAPDKDWKRAAFSGLLWTGFSIYFRQYFDRRHLRCFIF